MSDDYNWLWLVVTAAIFFALGIWIGVKATTSSINNDAKARCESLSGIYAADTNKCYVNGEANNES